MIPEIQIRVNGLTINGAARGSKTGLFISPGGFTGWDDSPIIDSNSLARVGDGEFETEVLHRSRLMSVTGIAVAEEEMSLGHIRSRFNQLSRGSHRYTVKHQGETLHGDGVAQATMQFRDTGYRNGFAYANFLLPVKFVDPRKYGETNTFTAGQPAIHRGNAPARPTFVVTGASAGGYTITGPGGRRIVVTSALTAGVAHTIDTAEGEVMVGSSLGNISVFEPWTIGPGLPPVTHTISAGTLLVEVPDTFI